MCFFVYLKFLFYKYLMVGCILYYVVVTTTSEDKWGEETMREEVVS